MNKNEDGEEEESEGDEWNLNSQRPISESFKSENLSEEDKAVEMGSIGGPPGDQQQLEGGDKEDEEHSDIDEYDDDVFSQQEEGQAEENKGQTPKMQIMKNIVVQPGESRQMVETQDNKEQIGIHFANVLRNMVKKKDADEDERMR